MSKHNGYVSVDESGTVGVSSQPKKADINVAHRLEYLADELRNTIAKHVPNAIALGIKGVQDNAPGFSHQKTTSGSTPSPVPADAPRVLVMAQGKNAKAILLATAAAGMRTVAPIVNDRRFNAMPDCAHETVTLAKAYTPAIAQNAYAVLEAAKAAMADAVFLADDSAALAADDRFLTRLHDAGISAFVPTPGIEHSWTECMPSQDLPHVPADWRTCHSCKLTFDLTDFAEHDHSCPSCGTLSRIGSAERLAQVLDPGTFQEWNEELPGSNPLQFEGYPEKIAGLQERTGLNEAITTGKGEIGGMPCAIGVMDSTFLMGSMGSVVGEKVARLFDRATQERLPVILFCASGGARMQEGILSLMQMAKTTCAVQRHNEAGLLYISVMTDPTTGGVTASFATEGDIILAEPGVLIGFAGQRVIRDTIKQELPEGFQTAEFALDHGLIDAIVPRSDMRSTLGRLLALHNPDASSASPFGSQFAAASDVRFTVSEAAKRAERRLDLASKIPFLGKLVYTEDPAEQLERHAEQQVRKGGATAAAVAAAPVTPGSAWESVQLARNVRRPTSVRYIQGVVDGFIELHGDRAFGDDAAIVGGIGWIDGMPVTVVAEEKGTDLHDRIRRHFGCPEPEGYRKGIRLMQQAEKFGRPIVCIVDTQGAYCGTDAEERGQGNAIAESMACMAAAHVPIVSVLIGEGGSGGALALAVANRVGMQEHAVYSILSPEGFASILWKDGSRAPEAAEAMRMSAHDMYEFGVIDEVLSEGDAPAHENPDQAVANVREFVERTLRELRPLSGDELQARRHQRFAQF